MTALYIHVGYQRTATTFLQERLFSKHQAINYMGKTEQHYPKWLIAWRYWDDYFFYKTYEEIKREIEELFLPEKVNLVSSEAFISTGGEIYGQAQRIKIICPEGRIILVLRDPIDYIVSFYKYSVQYDKFIFDLEDSIEWKRTPFIFYKKKPVFLPDLFYDETINIYESLFGSENLCILKFEDMANDSQRYFKRLGSFMNIDFDLDEIKNSLKKKLNYSINSNNRDGLVNLKAKNLTDMLAQNFPLLMEKITEDDILNSINRELINEDTKKRLEEYFTGKCYNYY